MPAGKHWPPLALGSALIVGAIAVGMAQLLGGPRLFPLGPALAAAGTVVLLLWRRLVTREIRRRRELIDTHRMFNLQAGLPLDLPENCRACQMGGRCPVHGEDS